jgi:hypothetical protein
MIFMKRNIGAGDIIYMMDGTALRIDNWSVGTGEVWAKYEDDDMIQLNTLADADQLTWNYPFLSRQVKVPIADTPDDLFLADEDDPMLPSNVGNHLTQSQMFYLIKIIRWMLEEDGQFRRLRAADLPDADPDVLQMINVHNELNDLLDYTYGAFYLKWITDNGY